MGLQASAAVDVVQIAWMKLFEHVRRVQSGERSPLRDPGSVKYWLTAVTRNAALDVHRRRKRSGLLAERATSEAETLGHTRQDHDVAEDLLWADRRRRMWQAFPNLQESCRELLGLLMIDPPMEYGAIAEILGRPVGSIGPTRQRCLERLRKLMEG
jgi:RNA polymerase sigma factor (sigma-70 family)